MNISQFRQPEHPVNDRDKGCSMCTFVTGGVHLNIIALIRTCVKDFFTAVAVHFLLRVGPIVLEATTFYGPLQRTKREVVHRVHRSGTDSRRGEGASLYLTAKLSPLGSDVYVSHFN